MNVKGLKLNRKLIHLLNDSIETINSNNLHGIESFNAFSWKGFTKQEFKSLLNLFVSLDNEDCFRIFSDDQTFIFNYSTDVTELDIVTIAEKDSNPILIDIESKNGPEQEVLIKKVKEQLIKRKDDHLLQLMKGKSFLTIGYVNNEFVYAYYFDGSNVFEISNKTGVYELLNTFSAHKDVEDFLLQSSNMASIAKICSDIENGSYKFYDDTNKLYDRLIDKIGKEDASIVYGHAGTGKSVLALKLFFENENAKLLIVNSKLYFALSFNKKYYFENRATFNTDCFLNFIDKDSISIVDECQRISVDVISEIIKKSKMTYLFGDNRQACFKGSTLLKAKELEKELTKFKYKVSSKEISKARRYSDAVDKSLGFLTSKDSNAKEIRLPADYQIKLFYDQSKFLAHYRNQDGIKKIYVPVNQAYSDSINIGGDNFVKADYDDDSFSIWQDSHNYYGTTYHALSFDIDHCFVYLKNIHVLSLGKKQVMYYEKELPKEEMNKLDLFLNELNVLFTRGRKSLSILIDDIETYLYLNTLLSKLK